MFKPVLSLAFAAALVVPALGASPAAATMTAWDFDTAHTFVGFKVKHMMVSYTKGHFEKFGGTIKIDEKDPTQMELDVWIDPASVDTGNDKRDKHLASPDFFHVEKYPRMTFKAKGAKKVGKGKYKVKGDLTIAGVTRPVTLDVEGFTQVAKDPWGGLHFGGTVSGKINRKDFGLTWNKALETGGVLVGEEVMLSIDVELLKKK